MRDIRELIILRLLAIFSEIDGVFVDADNVKSVFRDRGVVPTEIRPAILLLDGKETRRTPHLSVVTIEHIAEFILEPQIFVVLPTPKPEDVEDLGPLLSEWRVKVLSAIFSDDTLAGILGSNGVIEYKGSQTDMADGMLMEGVIQLDFGFTYLFDPNDLTN